ncbi:MAG: histidine kinase dimerization/phospho-acceptor domain-containing protein [Fulvivirga sp.]
MNTLLEQKVNERTKELLLKNKKLEDYAHYNSHNIRGPLARILGLIHLWETQSIQQSEKEEMLSRIEESAKELDEMVRKVNQMLE